MTPEIALALALSHRCDDGHTVAEVLAHARTATHQVFSTGTPDADPVCIPVLLAGSRPSSGPERSICWAPDGPLALMVQLGAHPFAFYAGRLVEAMGGPWAPVLESEAAVLDLIHCAGGRRVDRLLAAAHYRLVYTDLFWAVRSDMRTLEVVVQLQYEVRGSLPGPTPRRIPRSPGIAPPPVPYLVATWSRKAGTGVFVPADDHARALVAGALDDRPPPP